MAVDRPDRRVFLKRGAALAGGLTLGAVEPVIREATASGQEVPMAKGQSQEIPDYSSDELIAYGERARFVTSVREPVNGRPSPDEFGLVSMSVPPCKIRLARSRHQRCTTLVRRAVRSFPTSIRTSTG